MSDAPQLSEVPTSLEAGTSVAPAPALSESKFKTFMVQMRGIHYGGMKDGLIASSPETTPPPGSLAISESTPASPPESTPNKPHRNTEVAQVTNLCEQLFNRQIFADDAEMEDFFRSLQNLILTAEQEATALGGEINGAMVIQQLIRHSHNRVIEKYREVVLEQKQKQGHEVGKMNAADKEAVVLTELQIRALERQLLENARIDASQDPSVINLEGAAKATRINEIAQAVLKDWKRRCNEPTDPDPDKEKERKALLIKEAALPKTHPEFKSNEAAVDSPFWKKFIGAAGAWAEESAKRSNFGTFLDNLMLDSAHGSYSGGGGFGGAEDNEGGKRTPMLEEEFKRKMTEKFRKTSEADVVIGYEVLMGHIIFGLRDLDNTSIPSEISEEEWKTTDGDEYKVAHKAAALYRLLSEVHRDKEKSKDLFGKLNKIFSTQPQSNSPFYNNTELKEFISDFDRGSHAVSGGMIEFFRLMQNNPGKIK